MARPAVAPSQTASVPRPEPEGAARDQGERRARHREHRADGIEGREDEDAGGAHAPRALRPRLDPPADREDDEDADDHDEDRADSDGLFHCRLR